MLRSPWKKRSDRLKWLCQLKSNHWLPDELFWLIVERNEIKLPRKIPISYILPIGSGYLLEVSNLLLKAGVITEIELDIIRTPEIQEKLEKLRLHGDI